MYSLCFLARIVVTAYLINKAEKQQQRNWNFYEAVIYPLDVVHC